MKMTRSAAAGAVAAAVLLTLQLPGAAVGGSVGGDRAQPVDQSLRALGNRHDLRIGTAVDMAALASDGTYRDRTAAEFSTVTPENVMKWEVVEPQRGSFDFSAADRLVDFARQHGQKVRGHTLLWHNQLPKWLTDGVADGSITADQLRTILRDHIFAEAGHFRGRIWQWDVVNEAINDDGTMRNTIWLQKLGPGYIADAFRWAHQADPHALLFYNDYNIEFTGAKHDAAVALVTSLKAQGVPIHGVGMQGHLGLQYGLPSAPELAANVKHFADAGLATAFTEVDVRMPMPNDVYRSQAQAQGYSVVMQACLLNPRCLSVTVWGYTDKYSWIPGWFTDPPQGAANLLDENFAAKPAYQAVRTVLAMSTGPRHRS
ncbi:endo-1,4-beta-xylanase [Planosporangium sp. 12N6]|uniref:endo-1,4-beta-xylanase n=1 Tax=Planosporangium spinosum TaxID=3402278 RepID=UPI003CE83FBB